MKYRILGIAAVAALAFAVPARAQEHGMAPVQGRHTTLTGNVVDVSCLVGSGAQGESHRMCAQVCSDAGLPLAILSGGRVYMALAAAPGQGTNARLREFAEHQVRVTGTVIEAHGVRGIKIDTVEAVASR